MVQHIPRELPAESRTNGAQQRFYLCKNAVTCKERRGSPLRQALLLLLLAALLATAALTWRQVFLQGADEPADHGAVLAQAPRGRSPFQVFDLSNAAVPRDRILSGGPAVDGIPAISSPGFVRTSRAGFLKPEDRIIGVVIGGEARGYPLRILDYHEAVNDRIGDVSFAVTYCPLCDSAAVFDRRIQGAVVELGISGLLLNSNVLLYDRRREGKSSLWSQVKSASIAGPHVNESLTTLPVELTTWSDWRTRHPDTMVLSTETGYTRDYSRSAYGHYFASPDLMFPVEPLDQRLPAKTPVLGVWGPKTERGYPVGAFAAARESVTLEQELDGRKFALTYDPRSNSLRISDADKDLQWMYSFWFAWAAFHPGTDVFEGVGEK